MKNYPKNINLNIVQVLIAYSNGYFPMGKAKNNPEIEWVIPNERGIIPVGKVYCSKSLKK